MYGMSYFLAPPFSFFFLFSFKFMLFLKPQDTIKMRGKKWISLKKIENSFRLMCVCNYALGRWYIVRLTMMEFCISDIRAANWFTRVTEMLRNHHVARGRFKRKKEWKKTIERKRHVERNWNFSRKTEKFVGIREDYILLSQWKRISGEKWWIKKSSRSDSRVLEQLL